MHRARPAVRCFGSHSFTARNRCAGAHREPLAGGGGEHAILRHVTKRLDPAGSLESVSQWFPRPAPAVSTLTRALADETRLRALYALRRGELCLCQLVELLGLAPSTVSKHMSVLHRAELVSRRKEGRWHFYRLAGSGAPARVLEVLAWVVEELEDEPATARDAKRLEWVRTRDLEELSACYRS